MKFDFYQQFKDFSNADLLKIIRKPAGYQPEAIAIATQIINDRNLTAEEIQLIDNHFIDKDNSERAKKERAYALKNKASDFLEPVLHPGEQVDPRKWLNIFYGENRYQTNLE